MAARWGKLYRGTPAELAMEDAVAALGIPYRTQWPGFLYGCRYFPDFVLPTAGIVVEVDDPSHKRKQEEDDERSRFLLERFGWVVVRVTNEEALRDARGALAEALAQSGRWPPRGKRSTAASLPRPGRCPPPRVRVRRGGRRAPAQPLPDPDVPV